jgi:hypothetical protein
MGRASGAFGGCGVVLTAFLGLLGCEKGRAPPAVKANFTTISGPLKSSKAGRVGFSDFTGITVRPELDSARWAKFP